MAFKNQADATAYQKRWYLENRIEVIKKQKSYRLANLKNEKERHHKYYTDHKLKAIRRILRYRKLHPEVNIRKDIRQRCYNPKTGSYRWYGAKGIECHITSKEVRYLWDRDKARFMKRPSIDRINPNGHYVLENCRFIEQSENTRRAILGTHS